VESVELYNVLGWSQRIRGLCVTKGGNACCQLCWIEDGGRTTKATIQMEAHTTVSCYGILLVYSTG